MKNSFPAGGWKWLWNGRLYAFIRNRLMSQSYPMPEILSWAATSQCPYPPALWGYYLSTPTRRLFSRILRLSRYPDLRISGFPAIRISGYPAIRLSGYPQSENRKVPASSETALKVPGPCGHIVWWSDDASGRSQDPS